MSCFLFSLQSWYFLLQSTSILCIMQTFNFSPYHSFRSSRPSGWYGALEKRVPVNERLDGHQNCLDIGKGINPSCLYWQSHCNYPISLKLIYHVFSWYQQPRMELYLHIFSLCSCYSDYAFLLCFFIMLLHCGRFWFESCLLCQLSFQSSCNNGLYGGKENSCTVLCS